MVGMGTEQRRFLYVKIEFGDIDRLRRGSKFERDFTADKKAEIMYNGYDIGE